ncbi:Asp-tRNA(Asn)/Glu-tRNA(Gln) amidotransferase subunit GatC [Caldanaerobius polysaccharolyticus]|uniref:Asp-tRNA(Asn)/Glu-tRNA(Gln) amidotransferase subunit GatC n=1 Tax=Caldanaerobius polysaccharolyticus TaxID=44256 RepID=UPI00047A8BFD|nr:Asp-tRNA(Asn)/Glu-tRNA(Gln) amidotransferase subunit GatC [Caldanaerobius polysaccharolyticus]
MIDRETVLHVARLARLKLSEEEIERMSVELGNILDYINKLSELDIEGVEPTAHILPVKNVFREDVVCKSLDKDKVLMNTQYQEDGCFKVPNIIE